VCTFFRSWGAYGIDLDRVAREAADEAGALEELVDRFGPGIRDASGALDRRALARKAFADEASRRRLTDVVWPRVSRRLRAEVEQARSQRPDRMIAVEAPLLLEWGDPDNLCDVVVVVTAPESVRIARTMARMGLSEAEVRARMAHQMSDDEKVRLADHVIVNDAGLADLESRAHAVWRCLTGEPGRRRGDQGENG
jgi:dephospho-CoA kinase